MRNYQNCIDMMDLLRKLAPLPRTIANNATDYSFEIINNFLPNSEIHSYQTSSKAWTWTIPKRWELIRGTIKSNNEIIVDSNWNELHVMNYSKSISGIFKKEELLKHIYTLPDNIDAIPFKYSFYKEDWGFSIPHSWLSKFSSENYEVKIESKFEDGFMNCLINYIPGDSEKTFIISSNICHPLQVNDSLTGVAIAVDIAKRLQARKNLKYSYLIMIVPETIGTVAYFSKNYELTKKCIGGFFSEMLGNDTPLVGQKSRKGKTYWDLILQNMANNSVPIIKTVDFLKSASNDEKVLDSPGVDIPTISLTRYPYKEYHTNNDNISIIQESKLVESRNFLQQLIDFSENDYIPILKQPGPIFLSGYDLYPDWINNKNLKKLWDSYLDIMYCIDGIHSVVELSCKKNIPLDDFFYWTEKFFEKKLIEKKLFIISDKYKIYE